MNKIVSCPDLSDLCRTLADFLLDYSSEVVSSAQKFVLALPGGSTPRGLYRLLAREPYRSRLPWTQVHFFWGDERFVPAYHPDSNYKLAHETFLGPLSVPDSNIHRIEAEDSSPAQSALNYETTLREFFGLQPRDYPRFDLILLGIGVDGHTASLFPGGSELSASDRLVTWARPNSTSVPRVTLTLETINRARHVAFLVSGTNKAAVLEKVLDGEKELPAALVKPVNGSLTFFVDEAAASGPSEVVPD